MHIPALPLDVCVKLGHLPNASERQFVHLYNEAINVTVRDICQWRLSRIHHPPTFNAFGGFPMGCSIGER